jgi:hypothetical protein
MEEEKARLTAVEWLAEQYYESEGKLTRQDFDHALKMERDRLWEAWQSGVSNGLS